MLNSKILLCGSLWLYFNIHTVLLLIFRGYICFLSEYMIYLKASLPYKSSASQKHGSPNAFTQQSRHTAVCPTLLKVFLEQTIYLL